MPMLLVRQAPALGKAARELGAGFRREIPTEPRQSAILQAFQTARRRFLQQKSSICALLGLPSAVPPQYSTSGAP